MTVEEGGDGGGVEEAVGAASRGPHLDGNRANGERTAGNNSNSFAFYIPVNGKRFEVGWGTRNNCILRHNAPELHACQ